MGHLAEAPHPARSLSVVIPAYNEKNRLPNTLVKVYRFLKDHGYNGEILVVDDGSIDQTRARLDEMCSSFPGLRVLGYSPNKGKGFATRTGILSATREAVLLSDADLSTPIEDIDRLWPFYDRGYQVVIASRHLANSEIIARQPLYRRFMARAFNLVVSSIAVRGFRDTQCGFKLFRRDAAQYIFNRLRTKGFAFDVEALMIAHEAGISVAEVPVRWSNAPGSHVHAVRHSVQMFMDILRMRDII